MYRELVEINHRPEPFEVFTAKELWTDEHTSAQMLEYHLNGDVDLSSRKTEFIERSAAWLVERFDLAAGKSVADFGCGPGLYTSRLAAAGAEVTGVDFSARSIEYAKAVAKREGLTIDYVLGDYLELDLAGTGIHYPGTGGFTVWAFHRMEILKSLSISHRHDQTCPGPADHHIHPENRSQ